MTGILTLSADPINPMEASTKQYVDAVTSALTSGPGTLDPLMNNGVAVGVSLFYSREDHIHPTDTSLVPLAGGTMTGALILAADPVDPLEATTKQYVDTRASSWQGTYDAAANVPDLGNFIYRVNGWNWTVTVAGQANNGIPGIGGTQLQVGNIIQYITGTTNAYVCARAGNQFLYVNKGGDVMGGPLGLVGDPTAALHAATKQYVDNHPGMFVEPLDNKYYARQGGVTPGWVPTVDEAPLDGGQYVRESGGWVTSTAFVDAPDNKLYARQGGATPAWIHTVDEAPLDGGQYVRAVLEI
jgi:hypothetical protein